MPKFTFLVIEDWERQSFWLSVFSYKLLENLKFYHRRFFKDNLRLIFGILLCFMTTWLDSNFKFLGRIYSFCLTVIKFLFKHLKPLSQSITRFTFLSSRLWSCVLVPEWILLPSLCLVVFSCLKKLSQKETFSNLHTFAKDTTKKTIFKLILVNRPFSHAFDSLYIQWCSMQVLFAFDEFPIFPKRHIFKFKYFCIRYH